MSVQEKLERMGNAIADLAQALARIEERQAHILEGMEVILPALEQLVDPGEDPPPAPRLFHVSTRTQVDARRGPVGGGMVYRRRVLAHSAELAVSQVLTEDIAPKVTHGERTYAIHVEEPGSQEAWRFEAVVGEGRIHLEEITVGVDEPAGGGG